MNRSDKFGMFVVAMSLLGLFLLNGTRALFGPVIIDATTTVTVMLFAFGVGLVFKKRVEWLWQDKRPESGPSSLPNTIRPISGLQRTKTLDQAANSRKFGPTPNAVVQFFMGGAIAIAGSLTLPLFYARLPHQVATYSLIPEALLWLGVVTLGLGVASIVVYLRRGALRYLAYAMLKEMSDARRSQALKERVYVFIGQISMLFPLFIAWTLLYFIGADTALATGNTSLYDVMIGTALVMAQVTQTSGGPALSVKTRKISATKLFVVGGLAMMLNLAIPYFVSVPYPTATFFQHSYFNFVVGGGAIGEFIYLLGFFAMGNSYIESKVKKSEPEFRLIQKDELFDMWASRFRNVLKIRTFFVRDFGSE